MRKAPMKHGILAVAAFAAGLFGGEASAHHSAAMFDVGKTVTVDGTVMEYSWSNPHVILWVTTRNAGAGTAETIAIEGTGPAAFTRMGLTKHSFNVGDKVKVEFHPLRAGGEGGLFVAATFADGKRVFTDRKAAEVAP
jgi:hypothetical protein